MRALPALLAVLVACNEYDVAQFTTEDRFFQGGAHTVSDVVFVVDDSASMAEEQGALASALDAFIRSVEDTEADWRLGVTTTSVVGDGGGVFVAPFATADQADAGQVLAESLLVGTDGDRSERGLHAAILAVDGRNADFRRDGARLEVVFVSDEDDQSDAAVDDYLVPLEALTGESGLRLHGVFGDLPQGCASPTGAADPAYRYAEAVASAGGWTESVCAASFEDFMRRVGLDTAEMYERFLLSRLPDTDTLLVEVESAVVEPGDVDGWTYDPADNAVVFHGAALPPADAEIVVTYVAHAHQVQEIE
jgi:hypothetical protein